jgi:hypothetical protein
MYISLGSMCACMHAPQPPPGLLTVCSLSDAYGKKTQALPQYLMLLGALLSAIGLASRRLCLALLLGALVGGLLR